VSSEKCNFGKIKFLSDQFPSKFFTGLEHIPIKKLDLKGYNKFLIESLNDFIDTQYCLIIQSDGFLINPNLWRDEFFDYDYIGAPWVEFMTYGVSGEKTFHFNKNQVGNGGFSLRSKKLLKVLSTLNFDELNFPHKNEDILICHYLYDYLIDRGIRFAPLEVAKTFSVESPIEGMPKNIESTLGFHGKWWMNNAYLKELASQSLYPEDYKTLIG
jgi:hypothetical protein